MLLMSLFPMRGVFLISRATTVAYEINSNYLGILHLQKQDKPNAIAAYMIQKKHFHRLTPRIVYSFYFGNIPRSTSSLTLTFQKKFVLFA